MPAVLDKSPAETAPPPTVTRPESDVPAALQKYLSLDDFEATARRRIPKFLYGYISGGAETDAAVRDNRKSFDEYGFVPRVLNDVSGRDQTTTLFGKTYAAPFGIPPMGSSALCAYRGDIVLTQAAKADNVPMILSGSSLITLEDVRAANQAAWYQAYLAGRCRNGSSRWSIASRRPATTPSSSPPMCRCRRTARTTSATAFRSAAITPRVFWDSVTHPHWLLGTWARTVLNYGMPHFENMDAKRGAPVMAKNLMRDFGARDQLAWEHVELIRKRWKGKLVVKGLSRRRMRGSRARAASTA